MHFLNPRNVATCNIYQLSSEENNIFIVRVHVYYFSIRRKVNSAFPRASIIFYNFASEVLVNACVLYMKLHFYHSAH